MVPSLTGFDFEGSAGDVLTMNVSYGPNNSGHLCKRLGNFQFAAYFTEKVP